MIKMAVRDVARLEGSNDCREGLNELVIDLMPTGFHIPHSSHLTERTQMSGACSIIAAGFITRQRVSVTPTSGGSVGGAMNVGV